VQVPPQEPVIEQNNLATHASSTLLVLAVVWPVRLPLLTLAQLAQVLLG
jgi:hypothetical protein